LFLVQDTRHSLFIIITPVFESRERNLLWKFGFSARLVSIQKCSFEKALVKARSYSEDRIAFKDMKILIIRPAALGDTLMLLPALAHLKHSAAVVFVGRAPGAGYLRPYVEACMDYETGGWHNVFVDEENPGTLPRVPPVDRVVAFLHDPEGLVMKNLASRLKKASLQRFPPFPPKKDTVHVALYLATCLQEANCPVDAEAALKEACHRPLFHRPPPHGPRRGVVFHPASGGAKKTYPPSFWMDLIQALKGLPFLHEERFRVLLGPAEEALFTEYQEKLHTQDAKVLITPDREALCDHLGQARLYVGPDSGITHLAAMHGTPTIALFKGSAVAQWRPLGPAVQVIQNKEADPSLIGQVMEAAKRGAAAVA
jgi:ADP-heptose:LPS heptosyltransferase